MHVKETYIRNLQQARTEHIRWVNNVKLLITGIDISLQKLPLNPTESAFGQWYYDKAILFTSTNSRIVLEDIEKIYHEIYEIYMKIYQIFQLKKTSGLFANLMKKKISAHEQELANRYYEEMIKISDQLSAKLKIFENQLHATPSEKFEELSKYETGKLEEVSDHQLPGETELNTSDYYHGARSRG